MANAIGRPTTYTLAIAEKLCERLATSNKGLKTVCKEEGMPHHSTVYRWVYKYPDFCDTYARARQFQTETYFDDLIGISAAPLVDDDGNALSAGMAMAVIQQRKLITDNMKFNLMKLQPKRFGENKNVNVDVKVNHKLSPEEFQKLLEVAAAPVQRIEAPQYDDADIIQDCTEDEDLLG